MSVAATTAAVHTSARDRQLQAILAARTARIVTGSALTAGWRALSAAYTDLAEHYTGRLDLRVTIAPHAAGYSDPGNQHPIPGRYLPATRQLDLDGALLTDWPAASFEPDQLNLDDPATTARIATLHGVFCHELGHAEYSRWRWPEDLPAPDLAQTVALLEEIRMERRIAQQRPHQTPWLRAAARTLLCDADQVGDSLYGLAHAATLTLGRVAAGTLQPEDVEPVLTLVETRFDNHHIDRLATLWEHTFACDDKDYQTLAAVAEQFHDLFADNDRDTRPSDSSNSSGDEEAVADALATSLTTAAAAANTAIETGEHPPGTLVDLPDLLRPAPARTTEADNGGEPDSQPAPNPADYPPPARARLQTDAEHVFPRTSPAGGAANGRPPAHTRRRPRTDEHILRRQVAAELHRARWRDRVATTVADTLPPGRLRVRAALQHDAQLRAGHHPTAQPWQRTRRRTVEQPRIRLATLLDVSGSMRKAAADLSSAAWVLANAVHDAGGSCATAAFGDTVTAVTAPGQPPRNVAELDTFGGTEHIADALDIVSGALNLYQPGPPRLVVILSDGIWVSPSQRTLADQRICTLRAHGVHILHVGIHHPPTNHGADRTVTLEHLDQFVPTVARTAVQLLQRTPAVSPLAGASP